MKNKDVLKRFQKDHNLKFYRFDGRKTKNELLKELAYHNLPYSNIAVTNWKVVYARAIGLVIILLAAIFINFKIRQNKQQVDVDTLFLAANVIYEEEPILVSTSYSGEELRIYKAYNEDNSIQYYYYFNQVMDANVHHLRFVNMDKDIDKTVDISNNFGNLSKLIEITSENNIEVAIVYKNEVIYSQFFIA